MFLRGDPGDCMYVVAAGAVAVSLSSVAGRDVLLAVLGPNQSFGELALVDDGPRVATVTARTRSVLVVVPRRAAADVMARQPTVVTALLVSLAALVRRLDEQACDAALLDLPRRVEKHLAGLARGRATAAERADGWVPVDVSLTQGDLARQIGGSRQQVNRVLMNLEAAGSITRRGHRESSPSARSSSTPMTRRREPSLPPQLGELPGAAAGHHPGPASRTSARGRYSSKTPSPL